MFCAFFMFVVCHYRCGQLHGKICLQNDPLCLILYAKLCSITHLWTYAVSASFHVDANW